MQMKTWLLAIMKECILKIPSYPLFTANVISIIIIIITVDIILAKYAQSMRS